MLLAHRGALGEKRRAEARELCARIAGMLRKLIVGISSV
jgi:hypothetical protein